MRAIALERGYGKWMTGKKASAATVAKMSATHTAIDNEPEERQRRSSRARAAGAGSWMTGRSLSDAHRAAIGASASVSYEERYGPDRADEERAKRRASNRARWADHEPSEAQREKHNADYRYVEWRTAVFERDDFTCQGHDCGQRGGALNAHHVLEWADHEAHRYNVENGVTLCVSCHRQWHRVVAP